MATDEYANNDDSVDEVDSRSCHTRGCDSHVQNNMYGSSFNSVQAAHIGEVHLHTPSGDTIAECLPHANKFDSWLEVKHDESSGKIVAWCEFANSSSLPVRNLVFAPMSQAGARKPIRGRVPIVRPGQSRKVYLEEYAADLRETLDGLQESLEKFERSNLKDKPWAIAPPSIDDFLEGTIEMAGVLLQFSCGGITWVRAPGRTVEPSAQGFEEEWKSRQRLNIDPGSFVPGLMRELAESFRWREMRVKAGGE